jgi:CBS domain-containing protein
MKTIEGVRRSGLGIEPGRTIKEAAELMEQAAVGALAVLDDGRPTGIVTDRDLVRRAMARGMALDARVDAVMSTPVVTVDADADLHAAFALFRTHGFRRLAVVRDDRFVGMLTVDDLLIDVASDLSALATPVTAQAIFGQRDPAVPATA